MHKKEELISVQEAAEIMGLSRMQVFRKIKAGELPAERVGRAFVINRKDLGGIYREINANDKVEIEKAIKKTFHDYREALNRLGRE